MDFLKIFFGLFKSFFIAMIFVVITMYIILQQNRKYITENWDQYKCNPMFMPMAGYFGFNAGANFFQCLTQMFSVKAFSMFQPIFGMITLMTETMGDLNTALGDIRSMINSTTGIFSFNLNSFGNRLRNTLSTMEYMFMKFKAILQRLYATFITLVYTMMATTSTMKSLIDGPIGGIADAFCFDPDTPVKMKAGDFEKIENIKVGDKLWDNNLVHGIIKIGFSEAVGSIQMYNYKGVRVSGSHLVYENGEVWKRVEDCKGAVKIEYEKEYIHSLITSNNEFISLESSDGTNELRFKDHIENSNSIVNDIIRNIIINHLNKNEIDGDKIKNITKRLNTKYVKNFNGRDYYCQGFHGSTPIDMRNNESCKISDLKIGNVTANGERIIALIKQYPINSNIYQLNNSSVGVGVGTGVVVAEHQMIYCNEKWQLVKDLTESGDAKLLNKKCELYSVITDKNTLKIGGFLFTDYEETNGKVVNEIIDEISTDFVN